MKNLYILSCAVLLTATAAADTSTQKRPGQSYLYQLGRDSTQAGGFTALPKGSLTEAELLVRLDKEGRDQYRSLSQEGKMRALELASHTGAKAAVQQVVQEFAQGGNQKQEHLLNNGMNRINLH